MSKRSDEPQDLVVSAETLERMREELNRLVTTGRDEMSVRLRHAREFGDIRENAEYDAAKDAQALMEARIRQLDHMIRNAVVREGVGDGGEAVPGTVVTVKEEGGDEEEEYLFAATPEEKKAGISTITVSSPLGKALAGKRVGERAEVAAPGGTFVVEVLAVRPSD